MHGVLRSEFVTQRPCARPAIVLKRVSHADTVVKTLNGWRKITPDRSSTIGHRGVCMKDRLYATWCVLVFSLSSAVAAADIPRLQGKPDLNGLWQAMNSANWNLEAHPAAKIESQWQLGALFNIPAGKSVIVEGSIPYLPEALKAREQFRAGWPKSDPETLCYLPGIPRATYMPYPFQIFQGTGDILMAYTYNSTNRTIYMSNHQEPPVDTWMGRSNGRWDGDTLVIETTGFNARAHLDRAGNHFSSALKVTERFKLRNENVLWYEATLEDPNTYSKAWTIRMPLYKHVEDGAQLLEHKCVPFVEELLYKDLELPAE
jgi:hypothetical protein